jgi:hypothetical protein
MFVASINIHEEWFENALLSLLDLRIGKKAHLMSHNCTVAEISSMSDNYINLNDSK